MRSVTASDVERTGDADKKGVHHNGHDEGTTITGERVRVEGTIPTNLASCGFAAFGKDRLEVGCDSSALPNPS